MSEHRYATPEEAETAFYAAFATGDLTTMRQVWLEDDSICCIHPLGPRLQGYRAVLESWRQILDQSGELSLQQDRLSCTRDGQLSIHEVDEYLSLSEDGHQREHRIHATNIYQLTAQGWRLILHHASPSPRSSASTRHETAQEDDPQQTLH